MLRKEKDMEKKGEKCSGMRVAPTEAKLLGGEGAHGTTCPPLVNRFLLKEKNLVRGKRVELGGDVVQGLKRLVDFDYN
jgi:hypothetical protein